MVFRIFKPELQHQIKGNFAMTPQDSERYGQVDADAHQTTLDLLKEVVDYLDRLPKHPMTYSVLQKVRFHLDNPRAKAQEVRLAMLSKEQVMNAKVKSGNGFKGASQYTPTGLPIISASLLYPTFNWNHPQYRRCSMQESRKRRNACVLQLDVTSLVECQFTFHQLTQNLTTFDLISNL